MEPQAPDSPDNVVDLFKRQEPSLPSQDKESKKPASQKTAEKVTALATSIANSGEFDVDMGEWTRGRVFTLDDLTRPELLSDIVDFQADALVFSEQQKYPMMPIAVIKTVCVKDGKKTQITDEVLRETDKETGEQRIKIMRLEKPLGEDLTEEEMMRMIIANKKEVLDEKEAADLLAVLTEMQGFFKNHDRPWNRAAEKLKDFIYGDDEKQERIGFFRTFVERADGELLLLKKTINDRPILVAVTHFDKDREDLSEEGKKADTALIIDVFTGGEDENHPPISIGHMDWSLSGDHANGGVNQHNFFQPKPDHLYQGIAKETWGGKSKMAFKIDSSYENQDIGDFMLATSALVLERLGIKSFYPGLLLDDGKEMYEKFGITDEDLVVKKASVDKGFATIPINKLTESKKTAEVLADWV
jgi:hypothetical protein